MTDFTLRTVVDRPFDQTLEQVRAALGDAGFGILTEIDLATTLREKLGAELDPQVILGACQPELAHRALQADPSVAALLPCNVVVRAGAGGTVIEAFDPEAMVRLAGGSDAGVREVADDARARLVAALEGLR